MAFGLSDLVMPMVVESWEELKSSSCHLESCDARGGVVFSLAFLNSDRFGGPSLRAMPLAFLVAWGSCGAEEECELLLRDARFLLALGASCSLKSLPDAEDLLKSCSDALESFRESGLVWLPLWPVDDWRPLP